MERILTKLDNQSPSSTKNYSRTYKNFEQEGFNVKGIEDEVRRGMSATVFQNCQYKERYLSSFLPSRMRSVLMGEGANDSNTHIDVHNTNMAVTTDLSFNSVKLVGKPPIAKGESVNIVSEAITKRTSLK